MAHLSGTDIRSIKSDGEIRDSKEHDSVPLKVRMKTCFATRPPIHLGASVSHPDLDIKKEDDQYDPQSAFYFPTASFGAEVKNEWLSQEQGHAGQILRIVTSEIPELQISVASEAVALSSQNISSSQCVGIPQDCNNGGTQMHSSFHPNPVTSTEVRTDILGPEKGDANIWTFTQNHGLPNLTVKVKVEYSENNLQSPLGPNINSSAQNDVQVVKVKNEIFDDFVADDLDHIVLKKRQRMLQPRKMSGLPRPVLEGVFEELSIPVMEDLIQNCAVNGKDSVDGEYSVAEKMLHNIPERNGSISSNCNIAGSSQQCSPSPGYRQETESIKSNCFMETHEGNVICSRGKISPGFKSCGVPDVVSGNPCSMTTSALPTSVKVKVEPLGMNGLQSPVVDSVDNLSWNSILPVKSELGTDAEHYGDELDHMSLQDRINLLVSGEVSDLNISGNYNCSRRMRPSFLDYTPIVTECSKSISISRPKKRKRSATDSVQTAMEEDAPGLLQVLIDKGILVDEIRLYGGVESDDAMDDSFSEDTFSELEAVISKLFSRHQSVLKFTPVRCKKGSKASYCLACLLSLVEQTRYLRFRKWPVEWGWCRDLQSFIFVFRRHNRIVLERPEYGYATYFFELVDSIPIDWQIKRLVLAMKLTSCSRVTLIENKALLVGEDLTEGEARVLMEYGWVPNTGLATMLNYCDRVVHDKQNERDVSEWRSKIGKLLMDGYNGGIIVSTTTPKKVAK